MPAVHINAYQSDALIAFIAKHREDEAVANSFGEKPDPIVDIRPFECEVPGMLAVVLKSGSIAKLLYPVPRPVPKDPLFQHAGRVLEMRHLLMMTKVERAWLRDWMLSHGAKMDAPDIMPAGGCEAFSADEDAFGAMQMEVSREG